MRRTTLLISIALSLAVIAVACGGAAAKPTAEPPPPTAVPAAREAATEVPTAATKADDESPGDRAEGATRGQAGLTDPVAQACIAEALGVSLDPDSGRLGRDVLQGLGTEDFNEALESCGVDPDEGFGAVPGGFGGRLLGGAGAAGALTPEAQACLTEQLGEDFAGGFGNQGGGRQPGGARGTGATGGIFGSLGEDFAAALEECGVDLDEGGFGGFGALRGLGGPDGEGGGFRGPGDGSIQECLTELLGADALASLRNPTGGPTPELLEAFQQCDGPIPVEPDGGTGAGAGPIPVEPTVTPIPVSDLTIAQLTCLSGELEPADLASVVIATSSGDLSELGDELLAALKTCGVES